MHTKLLPAPLLALGLAVGLGAPTTAASQVGTPIRLASAYSADTYHTINLVEFAKEVREATAGRVVIEVRPNAELLKAVDILAGVTDGRADAGELIMSSMSQEYPVMGIDSFPFIVSGYEDAKALWAATRPVAAEALAKRRLRLLFAVPWPPQNLYSSRAINRPEDFGGLRMRYYNPATKRIAELVGATPVTVPIQMAAIERAIAAGEFDSMITSSSTGITTKAWTRMTHYYLLNAWIPKNAVFIGEDALARLAETDRKALLGAAQRAEGRGWRESERLNAEYEAQLAKNRIVVSGADPVVRRFLDRAGEKLAREWMARAQPDELRVLSTYMIERVPRTSTPSTAAASSTKRP
jgi:TRAP-type transport system periplasmic protein